MRPPLIGCITDPPSLSRSGSVSPTGLVPEMPGAHRTNFSLDPPCSFTAHDGIVYSATGRLSVARTKL